MYACDAFVCKFAFILYVCIRNIYMHCCIYFICDIMDKLPWGTYSQLNGEEFYNRKEEIIYLTSLLSTTATTSPPTIMLPGSRGVGKTVLLKKIKEEMGSDYLINYIDLTLSYSYQLNGLNEVNLIQVFYKSWIDAVKEKGLNIVMEKINKIFKRKNIKIGKTVEFKDFPVPIIENENSRADLLNTVLNFPQEIYNHHKKEIKGVIMIIDEFQALNDLGENLEGFLWFFRSLIQDQKNVAYIFAGSNNEVAEKLNGGKGAFGGRMLTIEVNPFSKETVKEYLQEKMPDLVFEEEGFDRFYSCTNGIPYYVNTFANLISKEEALNDEKVKTEFKKVLPLLADHCKQQWSRLNLKDQEILSSLIYEPLKRKEIGEKLNVDSGAISRPLSKLLKAEIITNENSLYSIRDSILKAWLKEEYEQKGVLPFRSY